MPCTFFHFSGFDPRTRTWSRSTRAASRWPTSAAAPGSTPATASSCSTPGSRRRATGRMLRDCFDNGVRIPAAARRLYLAARRSRPPFRQPLRDRTAAELLRVAERADRPADRHRRDPALARDPRRDAGHAGGVSRSASGRTGSRSPTGRRTTAARSTASTSSSMPGAARRRRAAGEPGRTHAAAALSACRRAGAAGAEAARARHGRAQSGGLAAASSTPGCASRATRACVPRASSPRARRRAPCSASNVAGYAQSEKGVGEAMRASSAPSTPPASRTSSTTSSTTSPTTATRASTTCVRIPYPVNLVHVNADQVEHFAATNGVALLPGALQHRPLGVGAVAFPDAYQRSFDYFDEIWVPTAFAQDAVARNAPIPVVRIPYSLSPRPATTLTRDHFGWTPDRFVFLFIFDFSSYLDRKNPLGLLRAFRRSVRAERRRVARAEVRAIARRSPEGWQQVFEAAARCPNVTIMRDDAAARRDRRARPALRLLRLAAPLRGLRPHDG